MVDEPHPRIWPLAAVLTAVFVLGGALGYLVGRPSRSPALHGALLPGQVRVPNLTGLSATDTRRVLAPLGLRERRTRVAHSPQFVAGSVTAQTPAPGTALRSPGRVEIELSSGPGPPPGPMFVFARSVLIPINRLGPYRWVSPRVALDGPPVSLGANTRVIGRAVVTPYQIDATRGRTGIGMSVSFRVTSYRGAAWYAIVRAFGRQRESGSTRPTLAVRPVAGGRAVEVKGNACRRGGSQSAPLSVQGVGRGGQITFVQPLIPRVSVYAFRARIPLRDIPGKPSVAFRVGDTGCRSRAFVRI